MTRPGQNLTRPLPDATISQQYIQARVENALEDKDEDEDNLNDFDSSSENDGDGEGFLESGKLLNDFLEIPLVHKPAYSVAFALNNGHEKALKHDSLWKKERSLPATLQLRQIAPSKAESTISSVGNIVQPIGVHPSLDEDRNAEDSTEFSQVPNGTRDQTVLNDVMPHEQTPLRTSAHVLPAVDQTIAIPSNTALDNITETPLQSSTHVVPVSDQNIATPSNVGLDNITEIPLQSSTHVVLVSDQNIATPSNAGLDNITETPLQSSTHVVLVSDQNITTPANAALDNTTRSESQDSDGDNINQFDSDDDEEGLYTSTTVFGDLPDIEVDSKHMDTADTNEVLVISGASSLVHDTIADDNNSSSHHLTESQDEGMFIGGSVQSHTENEASEDGLDNSALQSSRHNTGIIVGGTLGQDNSQLVHDTGVLEQNAELSQVMVLDNTNNLEVAVVADQRVQHSVTEDDEEDNLNHFDTDSDGEDNHPEVNFEISEARNSATETSNAPEGDMEAGDDEPLYIQTWPIVARMVEGKKKLDLAGVEVGEEDIKTLENSLMKFKDLEVLDLCDSSIGLEGAVSLSRALKHCAQLEVLILSGNMIGSNGLSALCNGLRYCNMLTKLVLSDNNIGSVGVKAFSNALRYFINIEVLDLSDNSIGEDGVLALADILKHCENLLTLNLSCNRINNNGVVGLAEGLQFCASLQTLSLSCINVDSEGVSGLVNLLKNCGCISNLDISCNKIDCSGVDAIADGLNYWPKMENLNLSSNEIRGLGATSLGKALTCCINLQVLCLSSNAIDAEGVQSISYGLRSCTKLHSFQISSNNLGSAGLMALSGALTVCNELIVLELSHNDVDCDGIISFATALATCVCITELNLSYNRIGSDGAVALADTFKMCPNLAMLRMSNNHIDSRGAFALASSLKFSNSLTLLNLSHNNIGIAGLEALKEVLKSCKNMKMLELSGNTEQIPHNYSSYSEALTSGRSTLNDLGSDTADIKEQHGKLNDFDSQTDEEVNAIMSTNSNQMGLRSLRRYDMLQDKGKGSGSDANSDKGVATTGISSSLGHQERESSRTSTRVTMRYVHSENELNDLSGDGNDSTTGKEIERLKRLPDSSHKANNDSVNADSHPSQSSENATNTVLVHHPSVRNSGVHNADDAASAEPYQNEGNSSEESNTNNLGSSGQFRSLESTTSASPQDNVDQVVTQFSNEPGRKTSVSHSEGEGKNSQRKGFNIEDTGGDFTSVPSGTAVSGIPVSLKLVVPEIEDGDAELAAAENASDKSKESCSNVANLDGSLSAASGPAVFSGGEGRLKVHKSTRKVVSDTGRQDTGTDSESGRRFKHHSFRPVGQDHLSSSLPVHLDHVTQQRANKSSTSQDNQVGRGFSSKHLKGRKHSSHDKRSSSGSDSDGDTITGAAVQGREKSRIQSISESMDPDDVPDHHTTGGGTGEEAMVEDDGDDGSHQQSVSDQGLDTVSTGKESESVAGHRVSTEEEGVYKFTSIRRHEVKPPADLDHFKEFRTHEQSYTPVSDDIGDEGSDNRGDFDSDVPCSEYESIRGRGIHIRSNSELYLDGLSTQGSPGSGGGEQQSGRPRDGDSAASAKDESIDSTHFFQSVPPPIMSHVLESSYGHGVLVPKTTLEPDRKSLTSDKIGNGSEKTKSAPKAGYLDNILAPDIYGEVNSENNLSAEDEEGRVIERTGDTSSDIEPSRSEKESDGGSGSEFHTLKKIKNGNVRLRRTTDHSDSDSVHSRRSRRKPRSKNVKKPKDKSGGNVSGSNSDNSADQVSVEKTASVASASVTASMTPSQTGSATGVWEGPLISDVDGPLTTPSHQSNSTQPFVPREGEELCSEDLMAAIKDPDGLDFMRALLSSGAKVNCVYKTGTYPIHQAVCSQNFDKVLMILEYGGDVNMMCQEKKKSALHYACEQKLVPIIQVLVLNGADLEAIDGSGMSVLHLKSTLESRDVVSFLLDTGMDINIKHECGVTPLCMAVYSCDIATVRFLLEHGADPNVSWVLMEKDLILTPLCLAAVKGNQAMVALLVESGADINSHDEAMYSPVAFAIMGKSVDLVHYFTELPDFDCTLKGLVTPFCIGVQKKQYECIEILVSKYRGGLKAMLRDSKRAGYQRLTSYIYEYRQYEVDPRPAPVKEEPLFPESLVPQETPSTTQFASSTETSGHAHSNPAGPTRPMPTFVPVPSNDGTAILINVLTEFAIIAIQASIGYDQDGPENLIKQAGLASLSHVESFFVSYFYNFEEYQRTGRLVADFIGSGTPAPMTYLFLAGHVNRQYFEALLVETKKRDLMSRLALALQQFPDMDIPCDGTALLDALFNMDQTGGNPLGGLTGGGFQFGNSGPYGNYTSFGSNQGQGSLHTGGSGHASGSMGTFRQQLSAATGSSSGRRQELSEGRNGGRGGATGSVSGGQRLGGDTARQTGTKQSRLVTSTSAAIAPSQQVRPSLSHAHVAISAAVTTSARSMSQQLGIHDHRLNQLQVGDTHSSSVSTRREQWQSTSTVTHGGSPSFSLPAGHVHSDSDIKDRNNLDDCSPVETSLALGETSVVEQRTSPEQVEHTVVGSSVPGDATVSMLNPSSDGVTDRYDEGAYSVAGSVDGYSIAGSMDVCSVTRSVDTIYASDFPSSEPYVHFSGTHHYPNNPNLGLSMYTTSPVIKSDVSASGMGAAMSYSGPQRNENSSYSLKLSGVAFRQRYEAIKNVYPMYSSECDENLKQYPVPDGRNLFSKDFKTSAGKGQTWIDNSDPEWKRLKEMEDKEGYEDGLHVSVTYSILKQKEKSEPVEKEVMTTTVKVTHSIGLNRRDPSPTRKPTRAKLFKSVTGAVPSKQASPPAALGRSSGKAFCTTTSPRTSKSVPLRTQTGDKSTVSSRVPSKQGNPQMSLSLSSARPRRLPETPPSRSQTTATVKPRKRPATEVLTATRGNTKALSPKSESLNSNRILHFFEIVDAVKSSPLDEAEELFRHLCLDPEVHNKWRTIGCYLFVEDAIIKLIDESCSFAEEKCLRMLREWKKSDISADYAELVYALTNCGCYSSVKNAKPLLPEAIPDGVTLQIPVPIDEETLTRLETMLLTEKDKGASGAEVILQGKEDEKFILGSMDRSGLQVVKYACMAVAGTQKITHMSLTINFIRSEK